VFLFDVSLTIASVIDQGPLIRPSATFSPAGEKGRSENHPIQTCVFTCEIQKWRCPASLSGKRPNAQTAKRLAAGGIRRWQNTNARNDDVLCRL